MLSVSSAGADTSIVLLVSGIAAAALSGIALGSSIGLIGPVWGIFGAYLIAVWDQPAVRNRLLITMVIWFLFSLFFGNIVAVIGGAAGGIGSDPSAETVRRPASGTAVDAVSPDRRRPGGADRAGDPQRDRHLPDLMTEPRSEIDVPVCYRHPKRETWVSCQRCGRPICPECQTPALRWGCSVPNA